MYCSRMPWARPGTSRSQADPGQVLLYRLEHRANLEKMKVNLSLTFAPDVLEVPTISRQFPRSLFILRGQEILRT